MNKEYLLHDLHCIRSKDILNSYPLKNENIVDDVTLNIVVDIYFCGCDEMCNNCYQKLCTYIHHLKMINGTTIHFNVNSSE